MTEKIGPKEQQVRALREARAGRSKGSVKLLRQKIWDIEKAPPKPKKIKKKFARKP